MPVKAGTVLLVEDDSEIRDTVQDVLEAQGYDVIPAENGKQAIDYLMLDRSSRPDLVILDLMMPLVTGWQVLDTIRRLPSMDGVPVVVMTAARTNKPVGADVVLMKPFPLEVLLETVHDTLHAARDAN